MWLIVGLGNPGRIYAKTRHNLGFMAVDALSLKFSIPFKGKLKNFICGEGCIDGKDIILIKPLTFMNKSGLAVRDSLRKYRDVDNLLVVHDDVDLDKGIIRIRKNGSSGGHRGIESIIEFIGTKDFLRLKIGIGRSERIPAENYVLTPFPKREQAMLRKTIEKAVDAIVMVLGKGIFHAQNKFHRE